MILPVRHFIGLTVGQLALTKFLSKWKTLRLANLRIMNCGFTKSRFVLSLSSSS